MIACSEVLELSDAFIDEELLVEVQAKILRHLRQCEDCAAFIEKTLELKRLVRTCVKTLDMPTTLHQRVRRKIGM